LSKGLRRAEEIDQSPDRSFKDEIEEQVAEYGTNPELLEDVDFVTTMPALKLLLAFVEGRLQEDLRAKGHHAKGGAEAHRLDMFRVGRLPSAPNAMTLSTTFSWSMHNFRSSGPTTANDMSYDVALQGVISGQDVPAPGTKRVREMFNPAHYRIVKYEVGGFKIAVRTKSYLIMSSIDSTAVDRPGMGVAAMICNIRDAGMLWDAKLKTRYAEMLFGEVGMLCRGVLSREIVADVQEVTRKDLELDRPSLREEAEGLVGKVIGLLARVKELVSCEGCKGRPLWLQYADAEFRLISPKFPDDIEMLYANPTEENMAKLREFGYVD